MGRRVDWESYVGKTINKWTVLRVAGFKHTRYLMCRCACGVTREVQGSAVLMGYSTHCGCGRFTRNLVHGQRRNNSFTPTWNVWNNMLQRCLNPKCSAYARYGARGITVCRKWRKLSGFIADMGYKPTRLTLDRIDGNKGYCKSNCRWADKYTQARNRSSSILTYQGALEIVLARLNGAPVKDVSAKHKCSDSLVREIMAGRAWPDAFEEAKRLTGRQWKKCAPRKPLWRRASVQLGAVK